MSQGGTSACKAESGGFNPHLSHQQHPTHVLPRRYSIEIQQRELGVGSALDMDTDPTRALPALLIYC